MSRAEIASNLHNSVSGSINFAEHADHYPNVIGVASYQLISDLRQYIRVIHSPPMILPNAADPNARLVITIWEVIVLPEK